MTMYVMPLDQKALGGDNMKGNILITGAKMVLPNGIQSGDRELAMELFLRFPPMET